MNLRLVLIVVLVIVVLIGGGAFAALQLGLLGGSGEGEGGISNIVQVPTETPTPLPPTPTPIVEVDVVIAVQDIPRGVVIQPNMIAIVPVPEDFVPTRAFGDTTEVAGRIARTDIFRENFILSNQLVDDLSNLANVGSDAAAILDANRVAVTLPVDIFTSVGYVLQPGDRVDVIVSMLFVDIDPDFQSIEPNQFSLLTVDVDEDGAISLSTGVSGTGEFDTRRIPTGGVGQLAGQILSWPVLFTPSEPQRPRLTTQRTVQDAEVVWVGEFPLDGRLFRPAPSPTPIPPTLAPGETEDPNQPEAPPPTPTPERPRIVTLAVRPQDAVILTYMAEAQLPLTFALRSARAGGLPPTDPVTLDYIMTTFNIAVPDRFNYGVEPAIRSIRNLSLGDRIELNDN